MITHLRRYRLVLQLAVYILPLFSFVLAGYVSIHWLGVTPGIASTDYLYLGLFITIAWSVVAERREVTSITKISAENTGLYACASACGITYIITLIALFLVHQVNYSRAFFVVSALILFGMSVLIRTLFRILLRQMAVHRPAIRVVLLGAGRVAARAAARIEHNHFVRCHIVGYIQLPHEEAHVSNGPILHIADLEAIENLHPDDIVAAVSPEHYGELGHCISKLKRLGKPIRIIANLGNGIKVRNRVIELGQIQMLDLDPSPTSSIGYFFIKRTFDLMFATLVLITFAVPMLIVSLIIKLTSPGPVLFQQERVGRSGKLFMMYKFRTMKVTSLAEGDTRWTTENDPRCTRFGAFLRRTSIDELPQFLNVIKGEMSIVGPRPERPHFVKVFRKDIAHYQTRHHLNVGITGWAQVNGLRGDTSIERRIRYDLYYLQHWSLSFDMRIILLTLWGGFMGKNAY